MFAMVLCRPSSQRFDQEDQVASNCMLESQDVRLRMTILDFIMFAEGWEENAVLVTYLQFLCLFKGTTL